MVTCPNTRVQISSSSSGSTSLVDDLSHFSGVSHICHISCTGGVKLTKLRVLSEPPGSHCSIQSQSFHCFCLPLKRQGSPPGTELVKLLNMQHRFNVLVLLGRVPSACWRCRFLAKADTALEGGAENREFGAGVWEGRG